MASRASIGGHPIHPMLIPFPIGLLVFSLIADLIYLWRGNPVWENYIAFYTLLGGIIGAAAAAIPGLIDWATLTDRAAVKVANWHARVNIIGLVIFIASFYLRTTSGAKWITSLPSELKPAGVPRFNTDNSHGSPPFNGRTHICGASEPSPPAR